MPQHRTKRVGPKTARHKLLPSRRSSLQVNLSYVSDLSDSGNETFRSTQPEESSIGQTVVSVASRILLPQFNETLKKSNEMSVNATLNVMTERAEALDESCQVLKDAILNKTRKLFDGEAELAVKTANVLTGRRQAMKEINEDLRTVGIDRNFASLNEFSDSIAKNPSTVQSLKNFPLGKTPPLSPRVSKINQSVILGGSDKKYRKLRDNKALKTERKRLMVSLTRMIDPRLDVSIESNVSEIGAPLTCSSFIADHHIPNPSSQGSKEMLTTENFEAQETSQKDEPSLTAMEITAVQAAPSLSSARKAAGSRNDASAKAVERSKNHSSDQVVSMEMTSVQSHIPLLGSTKDTETSRTSMNVNTSGSTLSRTRKSLGYVETSREHEVGSQNNPAAAMSLNVNTSLGSEEQKISNEQNNVSSDENESRISPETKVLRNKTVMDDSDTDSTDNVSLAERLRDISSKNFIHRERKSCSEEGPSFVEGTPYPPSRSILWKTQIRSETIRLKSNRTCLQKKIAKTLTNEGTESPDSDASAESAKYTTAPNSTVIPIASPCRINCNTLNPQIIQDSSAEDESSKSREADEKIGEENAAMRVPRKKKLLPLQDKFEIASFSPVLADDVASPKKSTAWMPRKHFRRRKLVRAVAEKRIETLLKENEDESEHSPRPSPKAIKSRKEPTVVKKPRRVISKKIVVKKMTTNELGECLGRINSEQSVASERSSMNEFLMKKTVSVAGRNSRPKKLVIVATGFSKGDVDLVKSVVKELGGAEINSTVNRRTTHVVSTGVRTINLLRGIIRGCWLVSLEWVLKSLEERQWLNAEQYEMAHFSKAVRENRRDRQIFGKAYTPELFTTCGPIHIEPGTSPGPQILKELVKTAGGRVTDDSREARLSIGPNGLREIWILDSITTGDLQHVEEYRRK